MLQFTPSPAEYQSYSRFVKVVRNADEIPYRQIRKVAEADARAGKITLRELIDRESDARSGRPLEVYRAGYRAFLATVMPVKGADSVNLRLTELARKTVDGRTYEYGRLRFLQETRYGENDTLYLFVPAILKRETEPVSIRAVANLFIGVRHPTQQRAYMERGVKMIEKLYAKYPRQQSRFDLASAYNTRFYNYHDPKDGRLAISFYRQGMNKANSLREKSEWKRVLDDVILRMK